MKPRWKKGVVLLQTLVMSVILSMIAVMVMKWVLARYMLAARNYRSSEAKARSQSITDDRFSTWNFNAYPNFAAIPTTGNMTVDGTRVDYRRARTNSQGSMPYTITIDQD